MRFYHYLIEKCDRVHALLINVLYTLAASGVAYTSALTRATGQVMPVLNKNKGLLINIMIISKVVEVVVIVVVIVVMGSLRMQDGNANENVT